MEERNRGRPTERHEGTGPRTDDQDTPLPMRRRVGGRSPSEVDVGVRRCGVGKPGVGTGKLQEERKSGRRDRDVWR